MPPQTVHRIVYRSKAVQAMTSTALQTLLDQARTANRAVGITGLLLYKPEEFVQVVEGAPGAVAALMRRIYHDERHVRIRVLLEEAQTARLFQDWSMAYLAPDPDGTLTTGGAGRFAQATSSGGDAPRSAALLAGFFKESAGELLAQAAALQRAG